MQVLCYIVQLCVIYVTPRNCILIRLKNNITIGLDDMLGLRKENIVPGPFARFEKDMIDRIQTEEVLIKDIIHWILLQISRVIIY